MPGFFDFLSERSDPGNARWFMAFPPDDPSSRLASLINPPPSPYQIPAAPGAQPATYSAPLAPGYNPGAPSYGSGLPQASGGMPAGGGSTATASQGGGGFFDRISAAFDRAAVNPLFNIGIGLLGTGQLGPGIQQGLLSYNQNRTANERRGLLGLQQQQLQATMAEQQRKRQQAAGFREALKAGQVPGIDPARAAQLVQLPDEQLISTFATIAGREPPKPINVNGRLVDPNDPTRVIADFRQTPQELAEIERAKALATAGINEPLVQVMDPQSPTGFKYVPRSQAIGQPAQGPSGLMMEFGPDGRPTLIRSGGGVGGGANAVGAGLSKPTINALEEQAMTASNALARLDQIQRTFKPEYQQFATRGANWWAGVREKMGANIPEGERQQLAEFSQFRRDAIQVVNQTIKDITGAAMSNAEAGRIQGQVPNVGAGVFDGDSPTEFKAKLDGVMKDTRNALLRANWARARGLDPLKTGVELSEVPALINKRGNEIAAEVKKANPNLDEQGLRQLVRMQLGREFGMLQ